MPDSFFAKDKSRKRKRTGEPSGPAKKKLSRHGQSSSSSALSKVNGAPKKSKKARALEEELDSDQTNEDEGIGGIDDMDLRAASDEGVESAEEDQNETPAEKRLRLARLYLDSVKEGLADGEYDAAEIDKDIIASRLKQDVMEHSGKLHLFIADSYDFADPQPSVLRTRGHRLSVTSAVASEDARFLFTASKDGAIVKWDLASGSRRTTFFKQRPSAKGKERADPGVEGHTDEVLALALSSDGRHLASGSRDRRIGVWDVERGVWVRAFGGHKDAVSALAFRKGTQTLYSGSLDRTLRLHDLAAMGFVEALFGHQDAVLGLDALRGDTALSTGARDKTARFWKIADESQLVFRGGGRSRVREMIESGGLEEEEEGVDGGRAGEGREERLVEGSLECCALADEGTFITGGDSGSLCLWSTQKKKPIFTQALAHGFQEIHSETEGLLRTPRWVTAVACLRYSDVFASGSWDGSIRLWKLDHSAKSFALAGALPVPGVINSLQLLALTRDAKPFSWSSSPGTQSQAPSHAKQKSVKVPRILLVAGVGQEHRLGRWVKEKEGRNGAVCAMYEPRT